MTSIDDAPTVRSGSDADPLVLLLHGYGSNEHDLPGLMTYLAEGLASASVRAPLTLGPGSYAWVPIAVPGRPDPDVTQESTVALLAWFDEHVAADRPVVLLGFSQGGLMVTQLLRMRPDRFLAGIVLSGFVLDDTFPGDAALAVRQVPVFFGHGDADPVIPPDATERASVWLADHTALTDRTYAGLAHAVSAEELDDVSVFLRGVLG
ncbi:MAG: alpha/beta fold hydrolase [Aeromicrobium sp.]